jgi:hypothetical protein
MKNRLAIGMLALLCLLSSAPAVATSRAMWTWEAESYAMVEDPAVADEAVAYLKSQQVDTIYLYADAYKGRNLIVDQPQLYRAFIERMHGKKMKVYALLGSWYLSTQNYVLPAYRNEAEAMFRRVVEYNASVPEAARFDGANLDIEPHILDEWDDDTRADLLVGFLDMSAAVMRIKQESGATLTVGPAIPFWLDGIEVEWNGRHRPASEHTINIYDYVALMDYRDKAEGRDSILSHAASEIAYANEVGKKVVIGLEVSSNDINKVTFHEEGPKVFEEEVRKVERALRNEPSFAGFAIHHYRAWRRWAGSYWE